MRTELNLLTRDGTFYVAFEPQLSPDRYAELLVLVQAADNPQELKASVTSWAGKHGLRFSLDAAAEPASE